jgi:hypothetical protein
LSPLSLPGPPPGPGTGPRGAGSGPSQSEQALVAWGLGTEAPTSAEVLENIRALAEMERQRRDPLRKPGTKAPAGAGTQTPAARRISRFFRWCSLVSPVARMVIDVRWRLRHPRRLTVLAIAAEAPNVVFNVLRVARAVPRRRPRMAVGSALVAAGIGSPAAGSIG